MNAHKVIILARKHIGNGAEMDSSARLCLYEAIQQYDAGALQFAKDRALKALRYSVGVFHPDYQRAAK